MISYIGGKSRMAKWIGEYVPNDIETYVEVFGGGLLGIYQWRNT